MRLPSQAENVCGRAGVAAQGGQPHGTALGAHGSHGRCYCDPLRCLVPSHGWELEIPLDLKKTFGYLKEAVGRYCGKRQDT